MAFWKPSISVLRAVLFGSAAVPLAANADTGTFLNFGPPANRDEEVPAPRPGYQWSPGYWNASNNEHVWQAGHWEPDRMGYHYVEPTWIQQDIRWHLQRGIWHKGDRAGNSV